MAQPTAGPWMSEGDRIVTTDGLVVADVRPAGTWITGKNAELLAAAPELLQALEEFVAEAEHWGITERNSAALVFALDAIARAKGEPSPVKPQSVGQRGVY